ncbi:MAG: hypothetical protein ABFC96_18405 [Thermoguttaceae bacterium]
MPIATYQGVVENNQIHLPEGVVLPEQATVYVVVPEAAPEPPVVVLEPRKPGQPPPRIRSPRLAHPEQAADFAKEVYPESDDA